jgi:hypothetical protein
VLPTIDLNNKLPFKANKVEHVLTKRMLSPKLHTKLSTAQAPPQHALRVGRLLSQRD